MKFDEARAVLDGYRPFFGRSLWTQLEHAIAVYVDENERLTKEVERLRARVAELDDRPDE